MEFQFPPKVASGRLEEPGRSQAMDKARASVYNKVKSGSEQDAVNLSPKAKLMQSLRSSYDKLQGSGNSVEDVKQKLDEQGKHALSSEEIVSSILQGTLFEAI